MSFTYQYDESDYATLTTAKKLARFILSITERDEMSYGEQLDLIDAACRYVKKNKNIKKGK